MIYADIIGYEDVKDRLRRMVADNRVPHALLFRGEDGCGHLPVALAFSQHLLCTSKTADGACGKCPACLRAAGLVHPDLHLVFPISKSKKVNTSDDVLAEFRKFCVKHPYMKLEDWFAEVEAENKQPLIGVDEATAIIRKLSYTSYEGGYKIMLVWQPERMNIAAANALLKILEEPPDMTVFILVCCAPDQLLATILSRVQQVPFHSLSDEEIKGALMQREGAEATAATQAAMLADGNYGEALRYVHSEGADTSLLPQFQVFMRLALKFDIAKAIAWVDEFSKEGREQHKRFIQYALSIFRDCLMYNYGERKLLRLTGDERAFVEKFAPFVNSKNYEKLVNEFNKNYYYVERNAHPKMLFMDLMFYSNEQLNIR